MKITIVIPTFKRANHVKKLWADLKAYLPSTLCVRVVFIVNGKDKKTSAYLESIIQAAPKAPSIIVIKSEQHTPAQARNQAIERAEGEWILFLDDDIRLPKHYFSEAVKVINKFQPEVLGGPEIADPAGDPFQKAYSFCQSRPFVTGHTHYRHSPKGATRKASEYQLILCHLWMKRDLFLQGFQFPVEYQRNEENVLLYQLKAAGKLIFYAPTLYVYHWKKSTLKRAAKATWTSGRFRMMSFIDYPRSFHPLFIAPGLFVLYLLALPLCWRWAFPLILLYGVLCCFCLMQCLGQTKNIKISLWAALLIPTMHLSYGLGILSGLLLRKNHRRGKQNILSDQFCKKASR